MRAALLIPLLLSACGPAPDSRGVARDEMLVQVVASGRAEARPDEARFTAGVQTIAASAAAASAGNNEVMNRVAAALRGLGVGPDDLQTRQITLSRIDYGPERGRFQANNMVEVRLRDVNRAGEAIAATTEAGANVLSGPNLTVSDREAATRSAYAQAYKAARQRADTYAEAAGLKVARVLAIRDAMIAAPSLMPSRRWAWRRPRPRRFRPARRRRSRLGSTARRSRSAPISRSRPARAG